MRTGILSIAVAGLVVSVFATAEARGWWSWGPDVNFKFSGSSFVVDVDAETGVTTTVQNSLARSKRGVVQLNSRVEYPPLGPREGCDLVGTEATVAWAAVYRDGSVLTGSGSGPACWDGAVFTGEVFGAITGTVGRFEGVTGTWEADASVLNSSFTGTLTGDFN